MKKLILIFAIFYAHSAWATGLDQFYNRYFVTVNGKGERVIIDKTMSDNIDIENYTEYYRRFFRSSDIDFREHQCASADYEDAHEIKGLVKIVRKSNQTVSIGKLMTSKVFKKLTNKLDLLVTAELNSDSFSVVANLDDPQFFLKQKITNKIGDKIIGEIFSQVDPSGTLKNLRAYAKGYLGMIDNKKEYSQARLLYYLTAFEPQALGLTEEEVKRATSSIFEFKNDFDLKGLKEAKEIDEKWLSYGEEQMAEWTEVIEERIDEQEDLLANAQLFALGFTEVELEGQPVIMSLLDDRRRKSDKAAVAIDMSCADYQHDKRYNYETIQVAIKASIIPLSKYIFRKSYKRTKYRHKVITEAMLAGYLETVGDEERLAILKKQAMNPLL